MRVERNAKVSTVVPRTIHPSDSDEVPEPPVAQPRSPRRQALAPGGLAPRQASGVQPAAPARRPDTAALLVVAEEEEATVELAETIDETIELAAAVHIAEAVELEAALELAEEAVVGHSDAVMAALSVGLPAAAGLRTGAVSLGDFITEGLATGFAGQPLAVQLAAVDLAQALGLAMHDTPHVHEPQVMTFEEAEVALAEVDALAAELAITQVFAEEVELRNASEKVKHLVLDLSASFKEMPAQLLLQRKEQIKVCLAEMEVQTASCVQTMSDRFGHNSPEAVEAAIYHANAQLMTAKVYSRMLAAKAISAPVRAAVDAIVIPFQRMLDGLSSLQKNGAGPAG